MPRLSRRAHRRTAQVCEVIVVLGRIAHDQTLAALGLRKALFPFAHGARHEVRPGLTLFDSFHCSRYNTNTRRLTTEMFRERFRDVRRALGKAYARLADTRL